MLTVCFYYSLWTFCSIRWSRWSIESRLCRRICSLLRMRCRISRTDMSRWVLLGEDISVIVNNFIYNYFSNLLLSVYFLSKPIFISISAIYVLCKLHKNTFQIYFPCQAVKEAEVARLELTRSQTQVKSHSANQAAASPRSSTSEGEKVCNWCNFIVTVWIVILEEFIIIYIWIGIIVPNRAIVILQEEY